MYLSRSLKIRLILACMFILLLSTSAYAFASTNTMVENGAGDGAAAISGYTVANIHYTLDLSNPSKITSVAFTLTPTAGAPAPTLAKAKLGTSSSTWQTCTLSAGTWTCGGLAINVSAADELQVVAAQ